MIRGLLVPADGALLAAVGLALLAVGFLCVQNRRALAALNRRLERVERRKGVDPWIAMVAADPSEANMRALRIAAAEAGYSSEDVERLVHFALQDEEFRRDAARVMSMSVGDGTKN